MNLGTRFDRAYKKQRMIRAIQEFDEKELSTLIADGADAKVLIRDKKLVWHFQRNLLPEADNLQSYSGEERKHLKEISRRLSRGNEIVKMLIKAGVFPEKYTQYSLCELEEKREPVSENVLSSGLWGAVSPEALKLILADGADVNSRDSSGLTVLHHIAFAPDGKYFRPFEMVKILIDAGADINALSADERTPLMQAVNGILANMNYTGSVKIAAFMVKHGAIVSYHNAIVSYCNDTHKASEALDSFIEEIEEYPRMSEAEFDLMTAVFSNDLAAVKEILCANPEMNINFQTASGYTPLMFAMQNKDTKILKYLLSHGADPNIRDNRGFTLLLQNTDADSEKIELVLNNGADPNVTDAMNCTLLNVLCKFSLGDETLKTVKILLSHGADPNIRDTHDGSVALMNCVNVSQYSENTADAVKFLLEAGAEVNARDDSGNTPLMYAAKAGGENQISVIKILLDNGADASMRNNAGDSALDIILDRDNSEEPSNLEAVKLLIMQGLYLNDKETHFSRFDDSRYKWALMFSLLKHGDTFAELIRNNTTEDLIGAVSRGLDMSVQDKDGKAFPEAAVEARNLELLKACLKTGENNSEYTPEGMFYTLLAISMNKYDADGVKLLLQSGINADGVKNFVWNFAVNYVPEASKSEDAKRFKSILDKGTEILRLLHEVEPSIPICDTDGRELTYTYVERCGHRDWDSELLPLKDDSISRVRHAVTYEALSKILSACPEVDLNTDITLEDTASAQEDEDDDEYDENESFEDITLKLSRRFSPEDFITHTEEEEAKILSDRKKFLASFREGEKLGKNILHVIAYNQGRYIESGKMLRLLCENGADVNMRSLDGRTPIIMAVKSYHGKRLYSHRNLENICELIRAGADLDLKDEKGFSFRKFIEEEDDDTDSGIIFVNTYEFAEKIRMPIFTDILRTVVNGANTHDADLLVASYGTNVKKISEAISGGADIEARTGKGYTPLMIASMFGTPETVKFLIESGADANIKDRFGNNAIALSVIAGEDNHEIIRVLSEAGVNIDSRNEDDLTPIMQAVADRSKYGAKLEKLKVLLSLGADPNLKPINGESAIKTAAENGMYLAVKEFFRAGVCPERLCE